MEKHRERGAVAAIEAVPEYDDFRLVCPYAEEDRALWEVLLFEAFGTRSTAVVNSFLRQLSHLTSKRWVDDKGGWVPDPDEFIASINIVRSFNAQNEGQAACAATFVSLYLCSMRLGRNLGEIPDERTAATLARVARSQGKMAGTISGLQGARTTRHETHVHYHNHDEKHVHMGGGQEIGGQGHATRRIEELRALPSSRQDGEPLRLPSGEGEAGLPDAWWGQRLWRSIWSS